MVDQGYIRHARRSEASDVPTVFSFIKELANCQDELHVITTTEENLSRTIAFDPDEYDTDAAPDPITPFRPARCLLAFNDVGEPAGMALYFYSYVTWHAAPGIYLEDLYVLPSERRAGHGKHLMDALVEELRAVGGVRIEWRVMERNETGLRFYEKMGAKVMEGWKDLKLEPAGTN
ncbi:N-acetyltransferase ats1 [Fusarium keratoplasticum]|uniref:N-acetyltransferase ats1 n=1 Tax=Fusarium keratoplasticum TaxID=1328300 RepID=A0ACC0QBP2_9HYPO|nr:N-acetyltransferase ats1 [Fusarium keratoplasticum]KAI8650319.1 N-acetyltransferase ats1 [Fusarium keratoplasticum]